MDERKMVRKQVYLESKQNEKVKLLSARKGKTEAEIIREAIDHYFMDEKQATEDPLSKLIGMVRTGGKSGSTMHDRDIYELEREK